MSVADWLPSLVVGLFFTAMGVLKLVGLRRGVVGGRSKPIGQRLCGT